MIEDAQMVLTNINRRKLSASKETLSWKQSFWQAVLELA